MNLYNFLKANIISLGTVTNCLNPSEEYFYLTEEKTVHRLKIHDEDDINDSKPIFSLETLSLENTIVSSDRTKSGEIIVKGFTNGCIIFNSCVVQKVLPIFQLDVMQLLNVLNDSTVGESLFK